MIGITDCRLPTWLIRVGLLLSLAFPACSVFKEKSNSPMTSMEQLLLTQAVERGLSGIRVPLLPATALSVASYGYTPDKEFARRLIEGWLLDNGFRLVAPKEARIEVRVVIHALGTEHGESFFGVPPISNLLIPVSLPELVFYRVAEQKGVARYELEFIDSRSGALVYRSPLLEGTVFHEQYTLLLWFTFQRTDISPPPVS